MSSAPWQQRRLRANDSRPNHLQTGRRLLMQRVQIGPEQDQLHHGLPRGGHRRTGPPHDPERMRGRASGSRRAVLVLNAMMKSLSRRQRQIDRFSRHATDVRAKSARSFRPKSARFCFFFFFPSVTLICDSKWRLFFDCERTGTAGVTAIAAGAAPLCSRGPTTLRPSLFRRPSDSASAATRTKRASSTSSSRCTMQSGWPATFAISPAWMWKSRANRKTRHFHHHFRFVMSHLYQVLFG